VRGEVEQNQAETMRKHLREGQAQKQLAVPQPAHEEAVKQEASPRVEGNIVYNRELRLLNPETREFERFVMPKGLEESVK
jgi:hypothetical protein